MPALGEKSSACAGCWRQTAPASVRCTGGEGGILDVLGDNRRPFEAVADLDSVASFDWEQAPTPLCLHGVHLVWHGQR